MVIVVVDVCCCLLFVVCCLLFVVVCCCLLLFVCCLFVVCCCLFVVCCLLFVVCCCLLLFVVVCCCLFVVCLLFVVVCLLFVVCCLLFVVLESQTHVKARYHAHVQARFFAHVQASVRPLCIPGGAGFRPSTVFPAILPLDSQFSFISLKPCNLATLNLPNVFGRPDVAADVGDAWNETKEMVSRDKDGRRPNSVPMELSRDYFFHKCAADVLRPVKRLVFLGGYGHPTFSSRESLYWGQYKPQLLLGW